MAKTNSSPYLPVVVRGNFSSGETWAVVEPDSKARRHSEHIDGTCVWPEVESWVLCRDAALHRILSRLHDTFLGQSKFLQCFAAGYHDLSLDYVDSRDLLSDRVLDLVCKR